MAVDDDHRGGIANPNNDEAFMEPPTSPLGIPSWLWLTLLTLFMLVIIWLSLRNLSHLLPLRIQHAIQDFSDRVGLARHIRLLERDDGHTYRASTGGDHSAPFAIDLDEASSEDEDDDELPLASRFNQHQQTSTFSKASRQQKLDRIVRLFSGGIQHARGYGNAPNTEEDEESVLDLPNLPSSNKYTPRSRPANSSTSPTLFRAHPQEGDASPLPSQFHFSPSRQPYSPVGGPLSPSLDRTYPRSPMRSPSLSRTPSLDAIVEETSTSPRTSAEQQRQVHTHSPDPF